MATICHPNHTKRSIPYCQALRILRICSNNESAKLRCTDLVDSLVNRSYNKRMTNKQIEHAFTNFANPPMSYNVIPPALCTLICSFTLVSLT